MNHLDVIGDPIADLELPWIVEAEDTDPVPAERLADEPGWDFDGADDNGQNLRLHDQLRAPARDPRRRTIVTPGVAGISLTDYSRNAKQKGWGDPCTGSRATVKLSAASVTVRVELAELVGLIMRANERDGYMYRAADTGAYNCRKIAGTNTWSNHAWAIAVDENWQTNPYTSPLQTDKPVWLRHRWNRYGFAWGGDYTGKKDAMHFEFMGTPAQAAAALTLARSELGAADPVADPNDEILTIGDSGPAVVALQETLNRWYPKLEPLVVDGDFGQATKDRVIYFQKAAGLVADGEVGPASREVLGLKVPSAYNPAPTPPPPPALLPGGGIELVYQRLPQETRDVLGAVTTNETGTPDGRGRFNHFERGSIYWTPEHGAFAVWGGIRGTWEATGWEAGPLGYPISHEFRVAGLNGIGEPITWAQSNFEHGYITWDLATGAAAVHH